MLIDSIPNNMGVGFIISTPLMALVGAVAILVPLLIHLLFRRRRRPVKWAAMQFVIQAWAARRKRVRMEQWILLTLRCLIPLVLGLALAQPFFGDGNWFAGPTHQYIIIDNGVSTTTTPQGGSSEFEQLRSHTADFIRSGNRGDRVTIITTTGSPENNRSTGDLEQAALYVDSMKPSFLETDLQFSLDEAITTITNTKNDVQNEIIVFSPFRGGSIRNTTDTTQEIPDNTSLRFSTPASLPPL